MLKLNEFAKEIHGNAVEHGWWDEPRTFGEVIALCHSELSEALEEYRAGRPMAYVLRLRETGEAGKAEHYYEENMDKWIHGEKPEGIATEMADCAIRILDWCGKEGVDVDGWLERFAGEEEGVTVPYIFGDAVAEMHCDLSMAFGYGMRKEEFMVRAIGDILEWAKAKGVDMERIMMLKHEYNKGRPYRHGGKKL